MTADAHFESVKQTRPRPTCRASSSAWDRRSVKPAGAGSECGQLGDVQWRRPLAAPVGGAQHSSIALTASLA